MSEKNIGSAEKVSRNSDLNSKMKSATGGTDKKFEPSTEGTSSKYKVPRLNLAQFKAHSSQTSLAKPNNDHENNMEIVHEVNSNGGAGNTSKKQNSKKSFPQLKPTGFSYGRSSQWENARNTEIRGKKSANPDKLNQRYTVYSDRPEIERPFIKNPRRHYVDELEKSVQSDSEDDIYQKDNYVPKKPAQYPKKKYVTEQDELEKLAAKMGMNPNRLFYTKEKKQKETYWEHKFHKFEHKIYKAMLRNKTFISEANKECEKMKEIVSEMREMLEISDSDSSENENEKEDEYAFFELKRQSEDMKKELYNLHREIKQIHGN